MSNAAYKFTGNDAANYEAYLGPLIFEPSAVEFLTHLERIPAGSILETSCGTGRLTKRLRQGFPAANLTATDISQDMLSLAKDRLTNEAVEFKVADGQQLPFDDETFDLVVNQYGLMFFPDKRKGFTEAYRVLKPGGHFAFATWDRTLDTPLFRLTIDENIVPFFNGEDTTRFYLPFSLYGQRQLNEFLSNAGFRNTKVILVNFQGSTDSPMNIVNGLFLRHPLGKEVKEKDPGAVSRIAGAIERSLIDHFGPGPFSFGLKAWIGIGQK